MTQERFQKIIGGFAAIAIAAILAVPASAKSNLRCTLTDETGKPLEKAQAVLVSVENSKEKKEKTDEQGVVLFKGMDDGAYQVYAVVEGRIPSKSAHISLSGNAEQTCAHIVPTPAYAQSLLQDGMGMLQQNKFPETVEKGKRAVEVLPGIGDSYYILAAGYAGLGNADEALKSISMAAKLDAAKFEKLVPQVHIMALDRQAIQAADKGDLDTALKTYEAMLKINPNDAETFYSIAVAHARKENYSEALKNIDKAIMLNANDPKFLKSKLDIQDRQMKSLELKK
ncbi:MAG: hypothetical protein A3F68_09050 [Acidobacteria bacterium RIFCSPLOWO2_12_FULL_54_10]|nr:MAG: hypothetical protein A3F68_09050 [Acidobacteria bacterium RIFCSPLOWO2_12_FULL_54_10]